MVETIDDVVASMRGRAEDARVDRGLWKLYADRVEETVADERENWRRLLKSAHELLADELNTMKKVLDEVLYLRSQQGEGK